MVTPRKALALRLTALAFVAGTAAGLAFGYLGWLHAAFDSFSHLRLHLSALLLAAVPVLLVLTYRMEALAAAVLALAAGLTTLDSLSWSATAETSPPADMATYRLLQMNLRYDHAEPGRALSLIGRLKPDVVTLNEVSGMWEARLAALEAAYPFRIICPQGSPVGSVAILSRRPFADGSRPNCFPRGDFATARIDFGGSLVEVAAIHLGWPWPFGQDWQVDRLQPRLARLGETALLAGDLNAVPWSHTARRVAAAGGLNIAPGIGPTWLFGMLPDALRRHAGLPIDNVMAKGGVVLHGMSRPEGTGSDHLPVLVEFSILPQERPAQVLHAGLAANRQ